MKQIAPSDLREQDMILFDRLNHALLLEGGTAATPEEFANFLSAHRQEHRYYHGVNHIADLSEATLESELLQRLLKDSGHDIQSVSNIHILVGIFHDVVQSSFDLGDLPDGTGIPASELQFDENEHGQRQYNWNVRQPDGISNEDYQTVCTLFGVEEGDSITTDPVKTVGLNEMLSAFYAVRFLRQHGINDPELIAGTVLGIAATIPFKKDYAQTLADRLEQVPGLNDRSRDALMLTAASIANRDIANFRLAFPAFIDNTMRDLAERNPPLRDNMDDPIALANAMGRAKFFLNLIAGGQAGPLFHQHNGYPSDDTLAKWNAQAQTNIEKGIAYLDSRILTSALRGALNMDEKDLSPAEQSHESGDVATEKPNHVIAAASAMRQHGKHFVPNLDPKETTAIGADLCETLSQFPSAKAEVDHAVETFLKEPSEAHADTLIGTFRNPTISQACAPLLAALAPHGSSVASQGEAAAAYR